MRKILVVFSTLMLIMILSTGCQKNDFDVAQMTLPTSGSADIRFTTVDNTVSIETLELTTEYEESTAEDITTEEETTVVEPTTEQIEPTTVEQTTIAIEPTTVEPTTVEPTTIAVEPTTETKPEFTFNEMATYMYVTAAVNVRTLPNTNGEIVTVFGVNHECWVTGQCNETGWYRIDIEGQPFYISSAYLSYEKVVVRQQPTSPQPTRGASGFVYYTVAGQWPEKDYEQYLYNCLADRGIAWWYPYAVAQIWAESRWTPTSYNGVDAGICQFNESMFPARAAHHANFPDADVWNPYDSLYVYSFYIRDVLAACGNDIEAAWSYYIKGHFNDHHAVYCNACWKWYNALEAK